MKKKCSEKMAYWRQKESKSFTLINVKKILSTILRTSMFPQRINDNNQ